MAIWDDLVESCKDAVGREVGDLNDVADVVDELNREVCRLRQELSLRQPTVSSSIDFAKWIGERTNKDNWFKYDVRFGKWYVHLKGFLTTEELYEMWASNER